MKKTRQQVGGNILQIRPSADPSRSVLFSESLLDEFGMSSSAKVATLAEHLSAILA